MTTVFKLGRVVGQLAAHLMDRFITWLTADGQLTHWQTSDEWERHINQALSTVKVEHTIRPMFEVLVIANDDMGVYCHDCNSILNGRYDTANAILACHRHRHEAHT